MWIHNEQSRRFKSLLHGLPDPEDEGPTMLRNVGDYLFVDMAQHTGRLKSAPSNI